MEETLQGVQLPDVLRSPTYNIGIRKNTQGRQAGELGGNADRKTWRNFRRKAAFPGRKR